MFGKRRLTRWIFDPVFSGLYKVCFHFLKMTEKGSQGLTQLSISCACRRITGFCDVPSQNIPLPMVLCHCNTCRHSSGLLCVSHVLLPLGSSVLQMNGQPCCYRTLQTRYFCGHCGCSLYQEKEDSGAIGISTGTLDTDGFIEMSQHMFVADTIDGGLSRWIPNGLSGKERQDESNQLDCATRPELSGTLRERSKPTRHLKGYCHCRGVQFTITRPNETPGIRNVPWPDVIMPYHSKSPENGGNVKWWLRANNTKYLAGICACNSCRLGSGYDSQTWAFIPKVNITRLGGEGMNYASGTLRRYESSTRIYREFCQICGATVFWHSSDRPSIVDVSVGLLDSERGARAEDWLEWWTERVSFEELALNKKYIAMLSKGLREWGEKQIS